MKTIKRKFRGASGRRTQFHPSIFQQMTPAESRRARSIARRAALAILG